MLNSRNVIDVYKNEYRNLLTGDFDWSWDHQMVWLDLLWYLMEDKEIEEAWVFVSKFNKEFLNEHS